MFRLLRHSTDSVLFLVAVAMGLFVSLGYPAGIALSFAMPCVCLSTRSPGRAFETAVGYFAAGLWPMLPGLEKYLGSTNAPLWAAAVWISCALILAAPWAFCWTQNHFAYLWRIPVTVLLTVVPPVGLIDFLSPLASAGVLFPAFGWTGLLFVLLLPGSLFALRRHRISLLVASAFLSIAANLVSTEQRLVGWEVVNTNFGDVSRRFADYEAARFIQARAENSHAKVLIFPEFAVPRWSEATEAFWKQTLTQVHARGQRLAIGAGIPGNAPATGTGPYTDFGPTIAALMNMDAKPDPLSAQVNWSEPVDNALLVLGTQTAIYRQRIPVPLGMWRPWSPLSVPLRLTGSGAVEIADQRAAVLICYEQLVPWPVLLSMLERPTVLVGISNIFWFNDTSIPRYQQASIRAWARLFGLPVLTAVNS